MTPLESAHEHHVSVLGNPHLQLVGRSHPYVQTANALVHSEDIVSPNLTTPMLDEHERTVVNKHFHLPAYSSKQERYATTYDNKRLLANEVMSVIDQRYSDEGEGKSMLLASDTVGIKSKEDVSRASARLEEIAGWPSMVPTTSNNILREKKGSRSQQRTVIASNLLQEGLYDNMRKLDLALKS